MCEAQRWKTGPKLCILSTLAKLMWAQSNKLKVFEPFGGCRLNSWESESAASSVASQWVLQFALICMSMQYTSGNHHQCTSSWMIFWLKKKVMGEVGGGSPGEENDSYGVAVKCQACTVISLHFHNHPTRGVAIPIFWMRRLRTRSLISPYPRFCHRCL